MTFKIKLHLIIPFIYFFYKIRFQSVFFKSKTLIYVIFHFVKKLRPHNVGIHRKFHEMCQNESKSKIPEFFVRCRRAYVFHKCRCASNLFNIQNWKCITLELNKDKIVFDKISLYDNLGLDMRQNIYRLAVRCLHNRLLYRIWWRAAIGSTINFRINHNTKNLSIQS